MSAQKNNRKQLFVEIIERVYVCGVDAFKFQTYTLDTITADSNETMQEYRCSAK